jgi:O-antigen/teichoic acid export membrane protein
MSATSIETAIFRPESRPVRAATSFSKLINHGSLSLALVDQGAVSCGNFLTNVMLARSLAVEQYGIFALFLDAILFLNSLQAALLIYPLTVRCAAMDDEELRHCAGTCVMLTLLMAVPLGLALAGYGFFIGAGSVAVWAVLGQTFWQCQETLRRTLLARRNYARALVGDCVSYVGQVVVLALLIFGHQADVSTAFMAMAGTSVAAALIQGFQVRARSSGLAAAVQMGKSFWFIGRWVMTANLTNLIISVCCSYALFRSHGKAAVGQYAAMANLLKIANPLFITLATMIVPAVALVGAKGERPEAIAAAWRIASGYGIRGTVLLAPFWALLLIFPAQAIALLYRGRPEYMGLETALRLLVGISMLTMINAVMGSIFNGLQRSGLSMAAQVAGAVACLIITIPMTIEFGLNGFLVGTLLAYAAISGSLVAFYIYISRKATAEIASIANHIDPLTNSVA